MKVAIISDIHDNLVNLKKCLEWCAENGVEAIVCCGDVTNGETLKFLSEHWRGPIHLVRGNMEIYDEAEVKLFGNFKYYGRTGGFDLEQKKVGLCHEPFLADELLAADGYDIIFYGHTHKPWQSKKNGVMLINPGTLGGVFQRATFAVWDTESDKPELKILDLL
jgi:putative phosphoesterase